MVVCWGGAWVVGLIRWVAEVVLGVFGSIWCVVWVVLGSVGVVQG